MSNFSYKDNINKIKQNDINNIKYLSTEEEFNLKLELSANNTNNFNKSIILKLKKKIFNYKILSICLISIIMILLIILSIILYDNIDENNNNSKNDIIKKEKNSNSSIFDIVYNDFIFSNYISGFFMLKQII